jgi:ketosteroid isomerase-like protein
MTIYSSPDEMMAAYAEALFAGDAAVVEAMYEEEAIYYRPTVMAKGRAAIGEFYQNGIAAREFLSVERVEGSITVRDDYAFQHGVYVIRSKDRASGEVQETESRSTLIFHRGDDGGWRFQTMQGN